jgi:AcrR family transcriptional regulator
MGVTTISPRQKKRLAVMRRVQDAALELIEERGFAGVTMQEVANTAGVGVMSVYRHFGTKERLVLWDDFDPLLLERFSQGLSHSDPLRAMQAAVQDSLEEVYATEKRRILRRGRLITGTPALASTVAADQASFRAMLAAVLEERGRAPLQANVIAGVLGSALEAAVYAWIALKGRVPLSKLVGEAFSTVRALGR